MSKGKFRGTGLVYNFTLGQILKSRSNLILCCIFLVFAAAAIPVMSLFFTDQAEAAFSGYSEVLTAKEFLERDQLGFDARYGVQYAYSFIVLMVCVFSVSYIVRAVVEEKASKLIESLVVSISPMALLLGKILSVMTYIVGLLVSVAAVIGLSWLISGQFLDVSFVGDFLAKKGISAEILNLGADSILAILISLILAYLLFSFLAGLAGAGCSNMDEVGGAATAATWAIMLGYFVALFGGMASSKVLSTILALCPVVSAFSAPAQYIFSDIGMGILLASWVIQLAVIAILLILSGRVYDRLLLYKGERLTMRKILSLAADKGGAK